VRSGGDFAFTAENDARAKKIIANYPAGRQASAVLPLLDIAQRQHGGWLSQPVLEYVAAYLEMPPIRVMEVASFYTMFNLKPIGRHHVQVCTNISCWLRGSDDILAACEKDLGVGVGETTGDGKFTLSEVECLGACVNAPMVQIDDAYYEDLDAEAMSSILNDIGAGRTPKPGSQIGRRSCEPASGPTTLASRRERSGAGGTADAAGVRATDTSPE
jgi:NADH-quinone oxidoreductase subunit E